MERVTSKTCGYCSIDHFDKNEYTVYGVQLSINQSLKSMYYDVREIIHVCYSSSEGKILFFFLTLSSTLTFPQAWWPLRHTHMNLILDTSLVVTVHCIRYIIASKEHDGYSLHPLSKSSVLYRGKVVYLYSFSS